MSWKFSLKSYLLQSKEACAGCPQAEILSAKPHRNISSWETILYIFPAFSSSRIAQNLNQHWMWPLQDFAAIFLINPSTHLIGCLWQSITGKGATRIPEPSLFQQAVPGFKRDCRSTHSGSSSPHAWNWDCSIWGSDGKWSVKMSAMIKSDCQAMLDPSTSGAFLQCVTRDSQYSRLAIGRWQEIYRRNYL